MTPVIEPEREINFDGLIGPTHNYAGLAHGNLASRRHGGMISNPRQAALEGLAKMKFLADLGVRQAVLPPQERPDLSALRRLGFSGSDADALASAGREDPGVLAACCSASGMWAANAATVSPAADTRDRRVHFTPANLVSQFHRSLEPPTTSRILRAIFRDESIFAHHSPLPACTQLADEGAANHVRLAPADGGGGVEIFVYGRSSTEIGAVGPRMFPARQTLQASAAVARLHGLNPESTLFVRQNPLAIDAGVFHNDVAAVGNQNVLFWHESAFADRAGARAVIESAYRKRTGRDLTSIEVSEKQVPLADAVTSYLFNSQLVTLADGTMALICPAECERVASARAFITQLPQMRTPIASVHFIDVRQSMNNGGGPACLRLRVALTDRERAAITSAVFLTDALYVALTDWVRRHYRDRLSAADLADPKLAIESRDALDELTALLGVGSIYPFQGA
ncbi:MAG TPA: N-succinylarginine dihydrolase [Tepidisphaeraceae bacterium]|nr:N-succinylarginine dihydrolase [Tepidisphaeraceae bacterium]